jgi:uncharacterized SAM-binding protein YcdF (DUF218 family)
MGVFVTATVLWLAGLAAFANGIHGQSRIAPARRSADAIIVLTGGPDRVNTGFDLLAKNIAGDLFISGVGSNVTLEQLLALWRQKAGAVPVCCVTLGHEAQNTAQNADETRAWVENNNIHSAYLVTADYHMPRALLEFRRALPGLKVHPYPVPSHANGLMILGEYGKTVLVWLRL